MYMHLYCMCTCVLVYMCVVVSVCVCVCVCVSAHICFCVSLFTHNGRRTYLNKRKRVRECHESFIINSAQMEALTYQRMLLFMKRAGISCNTISLICDADAVADGKRLGCS